MVISFPVAAFLALTRLPRCALAMTFLHGPNTSAAFDAPCCPVIGFAHYENVGIPRGVPVTCAVQEVSTMNVTPLAIEKLKEVITAEDEAGSALRVVAMPAGHGLQYMLTMEKEHQPDDTVLRMDGMEFLMDSDSAPFLEEATIDYVEEFGGRVGFVINNPMYAGGGCGGGGCGCGGGGCGCGGGGCGCGGH